MAPLKDLIPAAQNTTNTEFILLDESSPVKEGQEQTCLALVADETAAVHFQLWGSECYAFQAGDIIRLINGIFSYNGNNLVLRAGEKGKVEKMMHREVDSIFVFLAINMAKKSGAKKPSTPRSGYKILTLREESSGKKLAPRSASSMLKMEHLQRLATWAAAEASVPPLAALFGHYLAASGDAMGIPLDSSLFPCRRCETILQPGKNCTVRIKTNAAKTKCHKKSGFPSENNVIYTCHFCSHQNLKRGTPKGHMKEILASRSSISDKKPVINADKKYVDQISAAGVEIRYEKLSPLEGKNEGVGDNAIENNPETPCEKAGITVLSKKKRNRNRRSKSGSKKPSGNENIVPPTETVKSGSCKRRRKSWSSLKEIAESSESKDAQGVSNLRIPFLI